MSEVCWQDPEQKERVKSIKTADIVDVVVGRDTSVGVNCILSCHVDIDINIDIVIHADVQEVFQRGNVPNVKDALCFSIRTKQ